MAVDKKLLDVLVCPRCKGPLRHDDEEDSLECVQCRLRFAIREDIPVMLLDEAQPLD